jgi:hypothetical protein
MTDGPDMSRVVLLGASNLTRGMSTAVATARLIVGRGLRPIEITAALGHGRSYGLRSTVLARSLPGISQCGLWNALERRPPAIRCFALVTDIGNDILYGAEPDEIADWVASCLDRLLDARARIVVTQLPMMSIERTRRWQFEILKRTLFPSCRVSYDRALDAARTVQAVLRDLTEARGIRLIEPDVSWFGVDPIHVRMRHYPEAWATYMAPWREDAQDGSRHCPSTLARASVRRWVTLRTATPERWWLFGRARGASQPVRRLPDGTTISLY